MLIRRSTVARGLAAIASAATLQACGATPDSTPPTSSPTVAASELTVLLDFEGTSPRGNASTFQDRGQLRGEAIVEAVDGGRVTIETRQSGGQAVRFPGYGDSQGTGTAVLLLQPGAGDTRLDPGRGDFEFGADFVLDDVSEGTGDDNGNNLVQRGLAADLAQYKLQIEHNRASCRVFGSAGEVVVKSQSEIEPQQWYTVACKREANEVTLTLQREMGGPVERVSSRGATGSLTYPTRIPLVVGGKVSPAGQVVSKNSDQFNGAVDNVFVRID